jgi:ribosome-binding factor A
VSPVTARVDYFLIFSFVLRKVISVERRGQKYHRERLEEALREEIETVLEGELGDPRIGLVNVSEVQLSQDGRSARVFVVVAGDDEDARRTLEGLVNATGFIRHELAESLQLRHSPELHFQLDRSQEYKSRIDELLKRTRKRSG